MYTGTLPVHPVGLAAKQSVQSSECELEAGAMGNTSAALDLDATTPQTVALLLPDDPGGRNRTKPKALVYSFTPNQVNPQTQLSWMEVILCGYNSDTAGASPQPPLNSL